MSLSDLESAGLKSVGPEFVMLKVPADLTVSSLCEAIDLYMKAFLIPPEKVLVNEDELAFGAKDAVDVAKKEKGLKLTMQIVDLPADAWALTGPLGLLYSEGT